MKYITKAFEKKVTQAGKEYAVATLEDESHAIYEKVSVWADHPQFLTLQVGYSIDGEIRTNDKGYKSLYGVRAPQNARSGGSMPQGISKAMDRKEGSISQFQDNKEHSIMVASTASMATQILVAIYQKGEIQNKPWSEQWLGIRYWLVKNWQNVEQPKVGNTGVDYPNNNFPQGTPF